MKRKNLLNKNKLINHSWLILIILVVILWIGFLLLQYSKDSQSNKLLNYIPYNTNGYIQIDTEFLNNNEKVYSIIEAYVNKNLNLNGLRLKDLLKITNGSFSITYGDDYFAILFNIESHSLLTFLKKDSFGSLDLIEYDEIVVLTSSKLLYEDALIKGGVIKNDKKLVKKFNDFNDNPFSIYVNELMPLWGTLSNSYKGLRLELYNFENSSIKDSNAFITSLPNNTIFSSLGIPLKSLEDFFDKEFGYLFADELEYFLNTLSDKNELIITFDPINKNNFLVIYNGVDNFDTLINKVKSFIPKNLAKEFPVKKLKTLSDGSRVREFIIDPSLYEFKKDRLENGVIINSIKIDQSDKKFLHIAEIDDMFILSSSYDLLQNVVADSFEDSESILSLQQSCLSEKIGKEIKPYLYLRPKGFYSSFDSLQTKSFISLLGNLFDEIVFIEDVELIVGCAK